MVEEMTELAKEIYGPTAWIQSSINGVYVYNRERGEMLVVRLPGGDPRPLALAALRASKGYHGR
jgi:hypothetical protein